MVKKQLVVGLIDILLIFPSTNTCDWLTNIFRRGYNMLQPPTGKCVRKFLCSCGQLDMAFFKNHTGILNVNRYPQKCI